MLKLLFPHNSCGVVMGRGGEFIRQLITATGASVRISQPSEMIVATQERVVTISGNVAAVSVANKHQAIRGILGSPRRVDVTARTDLATP